MATVNPVAQSFAGATITGSAASAGGDVVPNPRGNVYIVVKNGGGSSINVTLAAVQTPRPAGGGFPAMTLADQVVAVANGTERLIGPIPSAFNNASGQVAISWSAVTSVTFWAFQPD